MKHRTSIAVLSQYWVPVAAYVVLGAGCYYAFWEPFLAQISLIAEKIAYVLYIGLSFYLLRSPSPRLGIRSSPWWCVDVVLCTYTIIPVLQLTLPLPRPEKSPIDMLNGFPSGHSLAVFALAWIVYEAHPRWGLHWFAGAVLIALARIDAGYHYPYQVLGGATLGSLLGWWICRHPQGLLMPYVRRAFQWMPLRFLVYKAGQLLRRSER